MDEKIVLGYNPEIKIETIQKILATHFPEYRQSVQGIKVPFIRLKKSIFVHAVIFVKQEPKKQQTLIWISGNMAPLAFAVFGFILHYILRGSFLKDVRDALEQELR